MVFVVFRKRQKSEEEKKKNKNKEYMERFTGPQEEQIFVEDEQIIKQFRFCSFILKKGYYLTSHLCCNNDMLARTVA